MLNQFSRTELLLGGQAMEKLKNSRIAIFGLGGVGSFVAEALCRSGIYNFDIFDNDTVCLTNLNRQLIATQHTIGMLKTEALKQRLLDINPNANIVMHSVFYMPENADDFPFEIYDYVVDAVDTVTAKLEIISRAHKASVKVISSMGAGNKLDPSAFEVADISETSICPLAKVMRRELRKRNINKLKVVYSKEEPKTPIVSEELATSVRRQIPGSVAFVPSVAGLIIAGEVIKDLADINKK